MVESKQIRCSFITCTKPAVWQRKDGWIAAPGSPPGAVCEEHHCWEEIVYIPPKFPVYIDVSVEWEDGEITDEQTVSGYLSQGETNVRVNIDKDLKIKSRKKGFVKTVWFHPHTWEDGLKTGIPINQTVNKSDNIMITRDYDS